MRARGQRTTWRAHPTLGMTQLDSLVNGWKSHFWAADREVTWLRSELEHSLWLQAHTLLVGRIDAIGRTRAGELFFGEWKTSSPRDKKSWKETWRLNPQSLTYGVLAESLYPDCHTFTVRKAFKEAVPTFDHAWFHYSKEELAMWRTQLCQLANEIRAYREMEMKPWPLNLKYCHQFGLSYVCPFFKEGCNRLNWDAEPVGTAPRVSHLETERRLNESDEKAFNREELVVLDATRVATWLGCRERFRREYVVNIVGTETEALRLGSDFHEAMAAYYDSLVAAREGCERG